MTAYQAVLLSLCLTVVIMTGSYLQHQWRVRYRPRFYVASGLGNAAAAQNVRDLLTAEGWMQTYDWTEHGSMQAFPYKWEETAAAELEGVYRADVVVVVMPGGRGTHAELGAALVTDTPVVFVADTRDEVEHGKTCVFYHHPNVVAHVRPGDHAGLLRACRAALAGVGS